MVVISGPLGFKRDFCYGLDTDPSLSRRSDFIPSGKVHIVPL